MPSSLAGIPVHSSKAYYKSRVVCHLFPCHTIDCPPSPSTTVSGDTSDDFVLRAMMRKWRAGHGHGRRPLPVGGTFADCLCLGRECLRAALIRLLLSTPLPDISAHGESWRLSAVVRPWELQDQSHAIGRSGPLSTMGALAMSWAADKGSCPAMSTLHLNGCSSYS